MALFGMSAVIRMFWNGPRVFPGVAKGEADEPSAALEASPPAAAVAPAPDGPVGAIEIALWSPVAMQTPPTPPAVEPPLARSRPPRPAESRRERPAFRPSLRPLKTSFRTAATRFASPY